MGASRACWSARRDADLHRRRRSRRPYPATFTVVRVAPNGVPDPGWNGTGVVESRSGPGAAPGIGATAIRQGPKGTTLVAGTDLTAAGTPRGAVVRLP